jgi:RNA polymerase sigma-70 factor (ECF subfamily)
LANPHAADADLVAAVLRKDRKATAEFVAAYADPVYSYLARRLLPREDLVDDLFQQVFLEAWQRLATWRGQSPVKHWLLGIARHKVQDHFRGMLSQAQFPDEGHEPAVEVNYDQWLDQRASSERVWQVLHSLPDTDRAVLIWRYWEQYSAEEMARQSGKTVKAVERMLARARERFRRQWSNQ